MKVAVFSTKPYDRQFLESANETHQHELRYFEPHLSLETVPLAEGYSAVSAFVNDQLSEIVIKELAKQGTKLIALRCAGYNNVNLEAASEAGIIVVRVPAYSPYAVAEHTVGLMLDLNRKIHRAYNRVREGNFSLDGLLGFDMHGKTVGIIGTGKIGLITAQILKGFGCNILAYDPHPNLLNETTYGIRYVELPELYKASDIISMHCPLTPQTHHIINQHAIAQMKKGVMVVNTSRGGVIDTAAAIEGLKSGKIGSLGLDVYEEEGELFFEDLSGQIINDDIFSRLLTFPNVIITGHQAFFTKEALSAIAETTLNSITEFEKTKAATHAVNNIYVH